MINNFNSFYLAAPWEIKEKAATLATKIEKEGFICARRWWLSEGHNDEELRENAEADFQGVREADFFILLNSQPRGQETSGKAVETGAALLISRIGYMKLAGLGTRGTNIFQLLDDFNWFDSEEALIEWMKQERSLSE